MLEFGAETHRLSNIIRQGADKALTMEEFIVREIYRFKASRRRKMMLDGERYYEGDHNILRRRRTAIGKDGELVAIKNLPNNRLIDNQYRKMVIQKNNYLIGKPVTFQSENKVYSKHLNVIFNKRFMRTLKNVGKTSLNQGIAWVYVGYNAQGEIDFKQYKGLEIIPLWADSDHTILDGAIHLFEVLVYEGKEEKIVEKVEVFMPDGIYRYTLDGGTLIPDAVSFDNYFYISDDNNFAGYNWAKIPLVPFKHNADELPLIKCVKSLQDAINLILSNFQNSMEEDVHNTILVLVNYDGQDLGEFRRNLSTYGAVKVRSTDGGHGDLKSLQIEVKAENYRAIIEILKRAIIENAMGYDAKDDRAGTAPNQMNIESMYNDIDLDANNTETEYQAAFEELLWFVNMHLYNTGAGDFENESVEIIFNRDMMLNEGEAIENCQKSIGIISDATIVANHPWTKDIEAELIALEEQKNKEYGANDYENMFGSRDSPGGAIDEK